MSTEYSEAAAKATVTNPLRISNLFHLALGAFNLLAGGTIAFLLTRELKERGAFSGPIIIMSAVLMALGLGMISRAWRDEKFRVQPDDLGPFAVPDKADGQAQSEEQHVRDVLNNGVKPAAPPENALLSKLYNSLPQLELAPQLIRWHAETQTFRIVHLMVASLGFLLAWVFAQPHVFALMVPVYLYLTINPVAVARDLAAGFGGRRQMTRPNPPKPYKAIGILLFSIFAPILLGMVPAEELPVVPYPVGGFVVAILVGIATMLLSSGLFLGALKAQTRGLATSGVGSMVRKDIEVPSVSAGLVDSLVNTLPYPRRVLSQNPGWQKNGEFGGHFLIEAEREVNATPTRGNFLHALSTAWNDPEQRALVALGALGMVAGVAATSLALLFTRVGGVAIGLTALCLFSVSTFSLMASRGLWNRIDFRSVVYKLQYRGTYNVAKRVAGNNVTGSGSLTEDTVRVEHVEFWVAVASVGSVAFHRDAARQIDSIDLDRAQCQQLFDRIEDFYAHVAQRRSAAYREEGTVRRIVQGDAAVPQETPLPLEHVLSDNSPMP